ncbi:hypothetical protein [Terriglobus sp.]|uniref:hypothetical protein n=1 Tax=Terriglobus sp. TaxID=1889013 RepID=UPI003AFFF062
MSILLVALCGTTHTSSCNRYHPEQIRILQIWATFIQQHPDVRREITMKRAILSYPNSSFMGRL